MAINKATKATTFNNVYVYLFMYMLEKKILLHFLYKKMYIK